MDHLKMCPKCSGYMYPISERKGGFSGGKAVAGAILAGPIGIAAGALGKRKVLYQCDKCGYQKRENPSFKARSLRHGTAGKAIQRTEQVANECKRPVAGK